MKTKLIVIFFFFKFQLFSFIFQDSYRSYLRNDSIHIENFKRLKKLYLEKKYPSSLEEGLSILEKDINDSLRVETQILIAEIYRKTNNFNSSTSYFKKALATIDSLSYFSETFKNNPNIDISKSKIYLRLGGLYIREQDNETSKFYYNKVLESNFLNDKILSYKASALTNISGIYMEEKLYTKAKDFVNNAIEIHKITGNHISEAAALGSLASIYLEEEKYNEAKKIYEKALALIEHENDDRALIVRETLYYNLAYNYYILKDYEAYKYQELSYDIKDSLRDKNFRSVISEIKHKFNFESKKEVLQKAEENKRLIRERKFWIILAIGFIVIVSLTFYLILYYQRKKTLSLQLEKANFIQKQKIDAFKSESQTRILNATLDGKESERKEIAEALHDNVSALLSSANLHLQASRKHFNGKIPIELLKSEQIINEASVKIRDLSHNLMSSVLLKFGLTFAVRDIIEKYSNSSLNINLEIENLRRYDQKFEIKTFNIIQEFLNNILKHSKAENATVSLKEENNKILIRISDDGIGFDKTKINLKDGLGINQIDARINMMKGDFFIDSKKGFGTKIKVDLPIKEKKTNISA